MTIIEMLVSMIITLMILFAIVQIFELLGDGVNSSRAMIEMSGQMRATATQLQQDLDGVTVATLPWAKISGGPGYFEVVEGSDRTAFTLNPDDADLDSGDTDDVLAFTTTSQGDPFIVNVSGVLRESHVAEVVWFVHPTTGANKTLYRRVIPVIAGTTTALDDLNVRRNRSAHSTSYPHEIDRSLLVPATGTGAGEDVAIRNVVSFDVRVYDPLVEERDGGAFGALAPGDKYKNASGNTTVDYATATSFTQQRFGAFVDLAHGTGTTKFSTQPWSRTGTTFTVATWDTWPFFYEQDGVDQDSDTLFDEAVNGMDDNNSNGVDDPTEYETTPPYPFPLRGIQVVLRVQEPSTEAVRQMTISANFVPE